MSNQLLAQEILPPPRVLSIGGAGLRAFTPDCQRRFCDHLSVSGNVRAACSAAGSSAQTAYRWRRRCAQFALAWDAALVLAREHAEAVLAERALDGVDEPVFYHGEEVARRRRFDSRLLLAHLGRLDAHFEKDGEAVDAALRCWISLRQNRRKPA